MERASMWEWVNYLVNEPPALSPALLASLLSFVVPSCSLNENTPRKIIEHCKVPTKRYMKNRMQAPNHFYCISKHITFDSEKNMIPKNQ